MLASPLDFADRRSIVACRNAAPAGQARWLGLPIAKLSELDRALVIGSTLRKDHPLFAARLRHETIHGVYSSDLKRARRTAEVISEPHQLPVTVDAPACVSVSRTATPPEMP